MSRAQPRVAVVTGSRHLPERALDAVWDALKAFRPDMVVHGACPTGADKYAQDYCLSYKVAELKMYAQWLPGHVPGDPAGPNRNRHMMNVAASMLACGWYGKLFAFPMGKSTGTRGAMRLAKTVPWSEPAFVLEWK